jgi:hypothetical protein
MEELGFCADLHRPLAQAKPLTAGPSELTYLEFGSPNATVGAEGRGPLRRNAGLVRRARPAASRRDVGQMGAKGGHFWLSRQAVTCPFPVEARIILEHISP